MYKNKLAILESKNNNQNKSKIQYKDAPAPKHNAWHKQQTAQQTVAVQLEEMPSQTLEAYPNLPNKNRHHRSLNPI